MYFKFLLTLVLFCAPFIHSGHHEASEKAGLSVANKLDSMEICFIPDNDYRKFIAERLTPKAGNIVDVAGNILGKHPGLQFFTIGQRRKLGLKYPLKPLEDKIKIVNKKVYK